MPTCSYPIENLEKSEQFEIIMKEEAFTEA